MSAEYADANVSVFNFKKTVCMAILLVKNSKYPGFEICNSVTKSDDQEIRHQYRLLHAVVPTH